MGGVELAASAEFTGNLAGIAGATYRRVQAPPPEPVAGPIPPKSDKIKIDIVYDATPSMRGFTEAGESGLYTRVLRKLESAAAKEWPGTEVQLFRFGSEVTPLTSQDRLAPLRTSFYETRQGFIDTHIDRAVEAADPAKLTVLITDLFQTDTDVTKVTKRLTNKYAAKGLAVGVMGVKGDFRGQVYDIGIYRLHFRFERLRPFYVLALGKHSDVEAYFRSWKPTSSAIIPSFIS